VQEAQERLSKSDPVTKQPVIPNSIGKPVPPPRHAGESQYPVINIIIPFSFLFRLLPASYFLLLAPQEVTKKDGAPMPWPKGSPQK